MFTAMAAVEGITVDGICGLDKTNSFDQAECGKRDVANDQVHRSRGQQRAGLPDRDGQVVEVVSVERLGELLAQARCKRGTAAGKAHRRE